MSFCVCILIDHVTLKPVRNRSVLPEFPPLLWRIDDRFTTAANILEFLHSNTGFQWMGHDKRLNRFWILSLYREKLSSWVILYLCTELPSSSSPLNVTPSLFVWHAAGWALHHQSLWGKWVHLINTVTDCEEVSRKLCISEEQQESFRKAQLPPLLSVFVVNFVLEIH